MIVSSKHKFIFFKPLKAAGTSVEWALAMMSPLGNHDISTGHTTNQSPGYNSNSLYGDWQKNMETYRFLNYGKAEHYGPVQLAAIWPLLKNVGVMEDYSSYTISRNPWDTLVSYYWYAHSRKTMLAYQEETSPVPGDTFDDVRRKFKLWSRKTYRAPIFKESNAIVELPFETLARINEPMIAIADIVIDFENLASDCKEYFSIKFPLPSIKGSPRLKKRKKYYDYYEDDDELVGMVSKVFPDTIRRHDYIFLE